VADKTVGFKNLVRQSLTKTVCSFRVHSNNDLYFRVLFAWEGLSNLVE
jgi:hypothetical protein